MFGSSRTRTPELRTSRDEPRSPCRLSGMQDARETVETEMSETAMLCLARERLRAALELHGTRGVEAVLDESIDGARVLAADAKRLLGALQRLRTDPSRV